MVTSDDDDDDDNEQTKSSRALAKQNVAQIWASHRKSKPKTPSSRQQQQQLPICAHVKNAWEQTLWRLQSLSNNNNNGNRSRSIPSSTNETTTVPRSRHRVFESVTRQQVAKAVASQVVETLEETQDVVLSVLPAGYDFTRAIESLAKSRKRAFLLLDLAAICKAHVEIQKSLPASVELQYNCSLNRDAALLELLVRLQTSLRCNSNHDVLVAAAAKAKIVDHMSKPRKPNGYLKRISAFTNSFAVDGPDEVYRIHDVLQRKQESTGEQRAKNTPGFVLRLPNNASEWKKLIEATRCAAESRKAQLHGMSLDLERHLDALDGLVKSLQDSCSSLEISDGFRIDITGLPHSGLTRPIQAFFDTLHHSFPTSAITADVSHWLVAHAGALCTRIIGVKRSEASSGPVVHYYIDDGCYGSLQTTGLPGKEFSPMPFTMNDRTMESCTVWGPTCDGLDRVCREVMLPPLDVDDWLVFPNLGCGGFGGGLGLGTAFNGFEPPDTAYCVLGYFGGAWRENK